MYAEGGDRIEHLQRSLRILNEPAFSEFQREQRWRQLVARQISRHARVETRIDHIVGADVHCKAQRLTGAVPFGALRDRPVQRPASESTNEARLLGEGDEVGRWQQTARRMLPPQQYFRTRDAARAHFEFGLEEEAQFIVLNGTAQLTEEGELIELRGYQRII